jgi:hypothetical protein
LLQLRRDVSKGAFGISLQGSAQTDVADLFVLKVVHPITRPHGP